MDHEDLIKLLNQDLEMEFQSIVQYVQHVATISGAEYASTVDELKIHLTQELAHATALAEQISFLGGEPSTQVPDIATAPDSRSALEADLALETEQLEHYRERVQQANEARPRRRGRSPASAAHRDPGARPRPLHRARPLTSASPFLRQSCGDMPQLDACSWWAS